MLSPEERHVSVAMPIILVPGAAAGCCSDQEVEMATIELAKTPEDERIRIVTEDSPSDATLARSQSIETNQRHKVSRRNSPSPAAEIGTASRGPDRRVLPGLRPQSLGSSCRPAAAHAGSHL
jgi:cell division septation protein DedD